MFTLFFFNKNIPHMASMGSKAIKPFLKFYKRYISFSLKKITGLATVSFVNKYPDSEKLIKCFSYVPWFLSKIISFITYNKSISYKNEDIKKTIQSHRYYKTKCKTEDKVVKKNV